MITTQSLRFLIVEDNTISNQLIANQLEDLGHRVVGRAFNGPQGIEQVQQLAPDVVLLDLQMKDPETKREDPQAGIKAAQAIQAECPTPVVVLTAYESPELIHEATAAGIGAYLLKPPNPEEIERSARIAIARFKDIQSLNRLDQLLAASQAMAHVGSWELDLVTNQLTWSDEVYRIFGLQPQAFGATYEAFLEAIHPDDRATVDDAYSGSLRDGCNTYDIEHRIVRRDTGEVRIVYEKCQHFRNATGEVIRSVGMVQDITERVRAEHAVRESHAKQIEDLKWLSQAAIDLLSTSSTGEILDYTARAIQEKLEDSLVVVLRTSYDQAALRVERIVGIDDTLLGQATKLVGFDPRGRTMDVIPQFREIYQQGHLFRHEGGIPEFAASVLPQPVAKAFSRLLNIHHVYTIGLVGRERVLGNLHIFQRSPEPIEKPELVESLAQQVALALERASADEEIARAKEEWERTFDAVPDLITILDDQYRIVRANKAMADRLGITPEEAIGLTCYECVHRAEEPPPFCPHAKLLVDGQEHTADVHTSQLNGDFVVTVSPIHDDQGNLFRSVHVAHDITARKKAEDALRESEERYRLLVENTSDYIAHVDHTGRLVFASEASRRLYGYTPEEIVGTISFERIHPNDREEVMSVFRRMIESGKDTRHEYRIRHRDGHYVWFETGGKAIVNPETGHPEAVLVSRDITHRKEMEAQIQAYTDQLEEMVEEKMRELEEERAKALQLDKLASLGEMATAVAHELQQPLTAIHFEVDYLKMVGTKARTEHEGDLNAVVDWAGLQEIGENLKGDLDRSRRLIDHLRDFGRISQEPPALTCLNDPIEDSMIIVGARLHNHGVDVQLDLAEDLPLIMAHPHRLEQVFLNLISNAEHAMEQKAVDQPRYPKRLKITTTTDGDMVVATVQDNGCGIPEDIKARIFDPFFTTKPRGEGTGLGLSISYGIVADYDGEITCQSIKGEGTTFTLRFPVVDSTKATA